MGIMGGASCDGPACCVSAVPYGPDVISRPTGQAQGPYEAAFLPRLQMSLRKADEPVTEPVSKFGGQPVWLEAPG